MPRRTIYIKNPKQGSHFRTIGEGGGSGISWALPPNNPILEQSGGQYYIDGREVVADAFEEGWVSPLATGGAVQTSFPNNFSTPQPPIPPTVPASFYTPEEMSEMQFEQWQLSTQQLSAAIILAPIEFIPGALDQLGFNPPILYNSISNELIDQAFPGFFDWLDEWSSG
jgi:hypothetical protein